MLLMAFTSYVVPNRDAFTSYVIPNRETVFSTNCFQIFQHHFTLCTTGSDLAIEY